MWNGKKKAVTFSFDDGVTQDIRLVEILNKYGLKGTFNLNSAKLGLPGDFWKVDWGQVPRAMINASQVKDIYAGHEVVICKHCEDTYYQSSNSCYHCLIHSRRQR